MFHIKLKALDVTSVSLVFNWALCIIWSKNLFQQVCCHSKTDVLAGPLTQTSDKKKKKPQRLNWHQLVLVTGAVKKWPPPFNLKAGWLLQQMRGCSSKGSGRCVWEGRGLHQGGYVHSSIPSAPNKSLSHLPDLSFAGHHSVGKRRVTA